MKGTAMNALLVLILLPAFTDSFDYTGGSDAAPAWFTEDTAWRVEDGALRRHGGGTSNAVLEAVPWSRAFTMEAVLRVIERPAPEGWENQWAMAGIGLYRDGENYWRFSLVEAPANLEHRHFVELAEMKDGQWLAQNAENTRLENLIHKGGDFDWQYGAQYTLRLELAADRINGRIFDETGREQTHIAWEINDLAVRKGRPFLSAGFLTACFDDVQVAGAQPCEGPPPPAFPPYISSAAPDIQVPATGFFEITEIDGRWWFIDPAGNATFLRGVDHVNYNVHWCEKLGYAPYARNVRKKYGGEAAWGRETRNRLEAWGFNFLTANHSESLRHQTFPHTIILGMGADFALRENIVPRTTWTGLPDVFSENWPRHCDKVARRKCAPLKNDPWLAGYMLDNELEWYGKTWHPWGVFSETWKKPAEHTAKQAWITFLEKNLRDVSEMSAHFGVTAENFDALAAHREPSNPLTEKGERLARDWVRLIADRYFSTCRQAILRHDPNHLILGARFAGKAPDIWDIAGEYCDVVSFNYYPRIDVDGGIPRKVRDEVAAWQEKAQRPMMLTEWSFPALDSGLPCKHGAGMRVDTQAQRAQCFIHFQRFLFSLPYMVASDYFMYADEPELGISAAFPEDANYGLVNVDDKPYAAITAAAAKLNPRAAKLHREGTLPPPPSGKLAQWLREMPEKEITDRAVPMLVKDNGAFQVTFENGAAGRFLPLLHLDDGADRWVRPEAVEIEAVHANAKAAVMTVTFSRSAAPDAPACASRWRIWIPEEGDNIFAAQCLVVANTDTRPYVVRGVFYSLLPELADSSADDDELVTAPNYYRRGAAWVDNNAGLGIGCWYPPDTRFICSWWRDPENGSHHADLRQEYSVRLEPGESFKPDADMALFFGFRGTSLAAFSQTLDALEKLAME
jgi:hypothetical protein